ncbi:MAG: glycosyltransferase family 39 protein [Deltaproteobacteria bacterium]|nr:glycosyltransferase family 39 protein [Deltaproteobacteria bacterium]
MNAPASTAATDRPWQRGRALCARVFASDTGAATLVGLVTTLVLASTASQGFVRDEGYYFKAAREYHAWFEELWRNLWSGQLALSFTNAGLSRGFSYNWEHPGFVKLAAGWTWKVFHVWLGLVSEATGFRLASILMVAVGAAFTYLLGARLASRAVGWLGVALLFLCPHVFYHAHLACFDGPIMAMTVVVTYAFWRSLTDWRWVIGAGVAWGIAVATKHNAVFLIPTLLVAYAAAHVSAFGVSRDGRLRLPPIPLAIPAMLVLGPIIFYLCYPYGWLEPVRRISAYYGYHLHHEHYPVDYFGTLYTEPPFPWHYPFVMSGLTIPVSILLPGVVGVGLWLTTAVRGSRQALRRGGADEPAAIGEWLLTVSTLVPPAIIAMPNVPIFGGTKHWMPMMPFLALAAATVILRAVAVARESRRPYGRIAAGAALGAALLLPAAETWRTHPFGHTYFNELAGGHQGAAGLGMPRTFWGGDGRPLLAVVNDEAAQNASLFTHRMNFDAFRAYQEDGLLRRDIRFAADVRHADWALTYHQREYQDDEYRVWAERGDRRPRAVVSFDGVPIVSLYRLDAPGPASGAP